MIADIEEQGMDVCVVTAALVLIGGLSYASQPVESDPIRVIPADSGVDNRTCVDEMQFAWYPAGTLIKDHEALGGHSTSDAMPRGIDFEPHEDDAGVYLRAYPDLVGIQQSGALGMVLRLVNSTSEVVGFSAADGNLICIEMQALDDEGHWRAIEKHHNYWCGNSYHRVFLDATQYWEFRVPRYTGDFETKIRFKLTRESEPVIYSNEFEGSVHPEQFSPRSKVDSELFETMMKEFEGTLNADR